MTQQSKRTRRTFTETQKLETVTAYERGMTAAAAGDLHGVGPLMVYRWVNKYGKKGTVEAREREREKAKKAAKQQQPGAIARAAARALVPDQVIEIDTEAFFTERRGAAARIDTLKRVLHTLVDAL